MHPIYQGLITAAVSFFSASAGFWGYLRTRLKVSDQSRTLMIALLMGLAQQKIVDLGLLYIDRGWVSKDEYEDLQKYLYEPYSFLGGNGTVERIMHAVERLPFKSESKLSEIASLPIRESDLAKGLQEVASEKKKYEGEERRGETNS